MGLCLPICACAFVRLVLGLGLLCETRGDVPARFACVCVPRARAESIVRNSWGCACPVRACLCLVPWLNPLCETRRNVLAHFVCVPRARAVSIVRDSSGCAGPLFVRVCASCLG